MANVDEIIIEVEVNAGESAQRLAEVQKRLQQVKDQTAALKRENKDLARAEAAGKKISAEQAATMAANAKVIAENSAEIKQLQASERMLQNQIAITTQNNKEYGDSVTELGAQLAQLKAEYRSLSAAQRESAEGQDMLENIQNLDEKVKELDYSMGDFQRNVGNYPSAMSGLSGSTQKVIGLFQNGFRNGLTQAGQSVKMFSKSLLATPIGWITTAIRAAILIFNELQAAFKRNDDAGTQLSVALSALKPIIQNIREVFSAVAGVVAKVATIIATAASNIVNFFVPSMKEAAKAAADLTRSEDELEDKQRAYNVTSAKRAKQIAELRKQAVGDEKLSAAEREKIYKKIDELERKDAEDKQRLAEENYRILKEKAKQNNDTSDEMKDKLTEAYTAMLAAQTDYLNGTVRIASRESAARKEREKEEREERERRAAAWRAKLEERKRLAAEAINIEREELRKLKDLQLTFIEDTYEQQRQQVTTAATREIESLERRLAEEKNLTLAARQAINEQIVLTRQQMYKQLTDIDEQELAAANERMREADEQAAARAEKASAAARERVRAAWQEVESEYMVSVEERANAIFGNVAAQAALEVEVAEQQYQRLLTMDAETKSALFANENEYKVAVLAAEKQIQESREKSASAQKAQVEDVQKTLAAVTGALSDLYEAAAEDSESYEKYKKAIAIVDAVISMASTIAAATTASTAGDPYTMAIRIAANVAAVTAQFAAVIKAIKAAQIPTAGKFAEGGIVAGTQYNGDKLTARVNSGEMILTREQQGNLFQMIAAGATGVAFNYERMGEIISNIVKEMPAPVLVYSEFKRFERDVKRVELTAKKI